MAVVIKRLLCLDLPTAGLVIGYLGVFCGIWELIEILLGIVYFDDYYSAKYKDPTTVRVFDTRSIHYSLLFLMLVASLLDLLTSILLIRGTNKNVHKMLLPWLILKGIALTVLIPVTSLCVFVGAYALFTGQGSLLLINSILLLIAACVYSYLYMVIYSLYYHIRDEIQKPQQIDSENLFSNSNVRYSKT
ncbi:uncharacterized protein LOC129952432 [Eupeodes corollae]|uniref:uncharacterized protein LOC129952432 n=1 Tax=Eupeodes corollae TaxID=290404 RepID=UPI002491E541|nr:uncharacterized protein LOC129952432 [Eupeodes corollae]